MAKGMKRLVLDLRDNPGGALDQAIAISNRFLPKGDMIVFTKGRSPNSDRTTAPPSRANTRTCRSSCSSTGTARARRRS